MPADSKLLRQVMGRFATGVTIITTAHESQLHGMTANAFCSVSLDPVLVLVCVDRTSHTYPILEKGGVFAVNVLAADQERLSNVFADAASPESHDLRGVAHRLGVTGAPLLDGCLAYIDCRVVETYLGGDHTIFVGRVEDCAIGREAPPLLFYRGRYGLEDA